MKDLEDGFCKSCGADFSDSGQLCIACVIDGYREEISKLLSCVRCHVKVAKWTDPLLDFWEECGHPEVAKRAEHHIDYEENTVQMKYTKRVSSIPRLKTGGLFHLGIVQVSLRIK